MATKQSKSASSQKISFGKRKPGKHQKSFNKHKSPGSKYRGQGR